jgi:SAM-dependent methyltransferase
VNNYSSREYWTGLAETCVDADPDGFAPVLHPGTPVWYNRLIDRLQFRAVWRALALAGVSSGFRILDVGCGTGRWVRRYRELGLHATGLDVTLGMLRLARKKGTLAPLVAGEADRLPFASETFDCVSDITVVQHIPFPNQTKALCEMMRVLKPGGSMILVELIRGKGSHIFPRAPEAWIREFASCGARVVGYFGQEYLLLDRLFVAAAQKAARQANRPDGASLPAKAPAADVSPSRRAYWAIRRVTVPVSAWADPAAERILPTRFATHGVFVLRK